MTTPLSTPEHICNNALDRIGYKGPAIGNMNEGTLASKVAISLYGQTREELLRQQDWGFAERNTNLRLLKTAPAGGYLRPWDSSIDPILPWRYEYAYPDDCIKVRSIRQAPVLIPNYDPQPRTYRIAEDDRLIDPLLSTSRVILTNVAYAVLVYTGEVNNPLNWEPLFTETLCAALAKRFSEALAKLEPALPIAEQAGLRRGESPEIYRLQTAEEVALGQIAERIQG